VGSNGKISDATIWEKCKLKESILNGTLNLPPPAALPFTDVLVPYHILGDDIFPLTTYLMKPYPRQRDLVDMPRRISDFRLNHILFSIFVTFTIFFRMSRARRIVENAFGILVHRFEVFRSPIRMEVDEVKFVVLSCVFLHNWLMKAKCSTYLPAGFSDAEVGNVPVNGIY
jgi:DDE superfamily endonuclease